MERVSETPETPLGSTIREACSSVPAAKHKPFMSTTNENRPSYLSIMRGSTEK